MVTRASRNKRFRILGSILFLGVFLFGLTAAEAASVNVYVGNMVFTKKVKSFKDLKFERMVRQTRDYSCGAASLATILTYYFGRETTEEEILLEILNHKDPAVVARVKREGVSLLDLKKFAEGLGFGGKGYQLSAEQLQNLDRPAIALISFKNYNHFVVIKDVDNQKVYVADPARGNMVKSLDEFMGMWNGILLAFTNKGGDKVEEHPLLVKNQFNLERMGLNHQFINVEFAMDPTEF